MEKIQIDLLRKKYDLKPAKRKPYLFFGRMILVAVAVLAVAASALSYQVVATGGDGNGFHFPFFQTVRQLVSTDEPRLKGEKEDRINLLLMGIGGEGHDGPQLTDTLIFASVRPSDKKAAFISIPRDLAVPIPDHGVTKINSANAYGEAKEKGSGPLLAQEVVSSVLRQPIHYYVRVDFNGFAQLIDDLGGIDVYVERAFVDREYPILGKENAECQTTQVILDENGEEVTVPDYGCRFETLSFAKGWTHMDGITALNFVRSRHGSNGEGSDFARAKRQQLILGAVKDKAFSASTFLNPAKIGRILETLRANIATNLEPADILRFADLFGDLKTQDIISHVLDASPTSPLYATSQNGAYVLVPKNDDWQPIQRLAADMFNADAGLVSANTPPPPLDPANALARLEIQNGTSIAGLATEANALVAREGFFVSKTGNAASQAYANSILFDLSGGTKREARQLLKDLLSVSTVVSEEGWMSTGNASAKTMANELALYKTFSSQKTVDFVVILGKDAADLRMTNETEGRR
jgi:LCP family protein required for cell wall assembly